MKKYQLAKVASPCIEFEVGGHIIESTVITNTAKNPNFSEPLFFFDVVRHLINSDSTFRLIGVLFVYL